MDTVAVEQIIAEANAAIAALADPIEGWKDYADLDLSAETDEVVSVQREALDRRLDLLQIVTQHCETLREAIEELNADGHPAIPTIDVSPTVAAELDDQLRTQTSARQTVNIVQPTTNVVGEVGPERPTEVNG